MTDSGCGAGRSCGIVTAKITQNGQKITVLRYGRRISSQENRNEGDFYTQTVREKPSEQRNTT